MTISVEIGAWVEGATPKKNGSGMRKVWVAGEKAAGEPEKLSVILRDGERELHVLTLRVHDADARKQAREALTLALAGLDAYDAALVAPKAPQRPVPTRPAQNTRPAAKAQTRNPAPQAPVVAESADWFAQIMAQASA